MLERCRNDVGYLTLLRNVRLLFSNVRYLTSFGRLSDVYKIPPNVKIIISSSYRISIFAIAKIVLEKRFLEMIAP